MMNLIKYVLNSWLVDGNRETDLEDIYGTLHRSRVYFPYDIRVRSQSNFLANINRRKKKTYILACIMLRTAKNIFDFFPVIFTIKASFL